MNEFNRRFEGLDKSARDARYVLLARESLACYPGIDGEITFIAHNAGIVYRVATPHGPYLLKIAEPIGEAENVLYPAYSNNGFIWLDAIARETTVTVQRPVASQPNVFVTAVEFPDLSQPFYCTLQRWIEGQPLRDPLPAQVHQVGTLMAQLHNHGSRWIERNPLDAWQYGADFVQSNFENFSRVQELEILSQAEWSAVEQAVARILATLETIGTDAQVWGPVHGDIHHQNLVVLPTGEICPIDFGALVLAHYGYDLGVTLYHLMYLGAESRQALLEGYKTERPLALQGAMELETFLCMAALANLAFNVALPDQRTSALFIRNVREFAGVFCDRLVRGIPFALEEYEYVR